MIFSFGAAGVTAWAATKVMVKPIQRERKKALAFTHPVVLAHRGGLTIAPEHTDAAFTKSAELGVHGFFIDIRLTKDEEIVVFSDEYVNRTTDLTGKVADFTFNELKKADAGYSYVDELGEFKYRGQGERVLTLREVLEKFPQLFFVLNLMDSPDTYEGSLMPSKLWRLLEELAAEERVVVTSSYDDQIDRFNLYAQNKLASGAGNDEVKKTYATFKSTFGHLLNPSADVFIVPEKIGVFPLASKSFIHFLNQRNIPVYFKHVNSEKSLIKLMAIGAAGFIVDNPIEAMKVVQQYSAE